MREEMEQNIIRFPNSPTQKSNDNFLRRLRSMIISRFGLSVVHRHKYQLEPSVAGKLFQMSAQILDDVLYLPIHSLGELKGVLILREIGQLEVEEKNNLIDLLRATAIPYFEHLHRKEDLAVKERHIGHHFLPEKVIHFSSTKQAPPPTKSWDWREDTVESRPVPIWIEGDQPNVVYKAALELHHLSPRLIFLSFGDIDENHRRNEKSLAELNDSTIFVPDFARTSPVERRALFELFKNNPSHEEGPALYLGAVSSPAEVADSLQLKPDERRLLPRFHLNLRNVPTGNEGLDNQLKTFIQYSSSSFHI